METGHNDEDIYIRLSYGIIVTLCEGTSYESRLFWDGDHPELTGRRALNLMTVHIPLPFRRRGICTQILNILERRANKERVVFVVAPLLEQEHGPTLLPAILDRRGYRDIAPVGKFRPIERVGRVRPIELSNK